MPTSRLSSRKRRVVLGSTKVRDLESASRLDFICQSELRAWARGPVLLCRGQHAGELDGSKYHQRTREDGLRNRAETLLRMLMSQASSGQCLESDTSFFSLLAPQRD